MLLKVMAKEVPLAGEPPVSLADRTLPPPLMQLPKFQVPLPEAVQSISTFLLVADPI